MTKTIDLDAAGEWTAAVRMNGQDHSFDVFSVWGLLVDLRAKFPPETTPLWSYYAGIADGLVSAGLPKMNAKQVETFITQINQMIGDLEKKAEVATGSPAESRDSTESTPSTGPATS